MKVFFFKLFKLNFNINKMLMISTLSDVIRYSANCRGSALFQSSRSDLHIFNASLVECDKAI